MSALFGFYWIAPEAADLQPARCVWFHHCSHILRQLGDTRSDLASSHSNDHALGRPVRPTKPPRTIGNAIGFDMSALLSTSFRHVDRRVCACRGIIRQTLNLEINALPRPFFSRQPAGAELAPHPTNFISLEIEFDRPRTIPISQACSCHSTGIPSVLLLWHLSRKCRPKRGESLVTMAGRTAVFPVLLSQKDLPTKMRLQPRRPVLLRVRRRRSRSSVLLTPSAKRVLAWDSRTRLPFKRKQYLLLSKVEISSGWRKLAVERQPRSRSLSFKVRIVTDHENRFDS